MAAAAELFSNRKFWAHRFGIAPELPMSREEMDVLGWDSCDIILVTGDAYIDHPSFGMALIGRLLESQGFRVGIISQPDWLSADDFRQLGKPNLFFGVTGGNMDSMVNRYTSDRRIRTNDAYTADGEGGKRPDRCVVPYSQRCREAYKGVPIIIGGIEASLRRIAHYDYWSEKVRRSVIMDSKADILVFGNGERQVVEIAHRLARNEDVKDIIDIRGTAVVIKHGHREGWWEKDSTSVDTPGKLNPPMDPYQMKTAASCDEEKPKDKMADGAQVIHFKRAEIKDKKHTVVRLPAYQMVKDDKVLYAHTSRILHLETNPGNAFALVQQHGERDVWLNPPPIPLTTEEMDGVFDLPYSRVPHKQYGDKNIPAFEMIRFSVNIMRGCFGGCTFCSITEHEGRIIQSRSEDSIIREVEAIRDTAPGFTGVISDLGGPTANMYRLACNDKKIEESCRRLSCVYPSICKNLGTDHTPLINLYKRARALPGIKKILIASGLRYDLAVLSPEYVKELVTHHVGGYLKIAPEHTEEGPLDQMMKPGIGTYDAFKAMFDKYSKEAGKEQYLIPYFIAAHPGTNDKDMMNLAIWLKKNGFRADQVQAYLPSPMSAAAAMYHSGKNTLSKVKRRGGDITVPKGIKVRRLHKAFLRYHDPENWPMLREALQKMGRADLIGNGKKHLIPTWQPAGTGDKGEGKRVRYSSHNKAGKSFATQHVRSNSAKSKPAKRRRR
ncbi:MAG: YgiQ family radical SAM protein [Gammaproteobacteria bacterium]|nr:MAG: YgiQ family radical SAM protein [Gammaproteobacteria bacterium]